MMFAAASTGAAAALSARAAGVLSGDPPNSASSCSSSCARASSIHASSWGRPRARRAAVVVVRASQHDWWPAPVTEAPVGQGSTALATHGSDLKHKDIRLRAKELANINPNDPRALDAIGSKVPCKVRFTVPYDTKLGEDVLIIGSHEKLGAWNQNNACAMTWSDGNIWFADLELPAGGIFFYKYVVKTDHGYKWQEGANNLLVLPDPWDIPAGSVFVVDDNFSGVSRDSQNQLAVKLISFEKEIVRLQMETNKAKEMTKASLQELLITREQLAEANMKLEHYERNMETVISSMQQSQFNAR